MDFLKKNRTAIGGLIIVVLALYLYYSHSSGTSPTLTATPQSASADSELLATLETLPTIVLDEKIFQDPSFKSLSDFGVTIPPQEAGRRNPFAPIGK